LPIIHLKNRTLLKRYFETSAFFRLKCIICCHNSEILFCAQSANSLIAINSNGCNLSGGEQLCIFHQGEKSLLFA